MKKLVLLSLILLILIPELDAQRRNGRIRRRSSSAGSIVASFGPAYCFGDSKDSPFSKTFLDGTNANFSLGFRQRFPTNFAYKGTLTYGDYTGTENSTSRGLDFHSQIIQLSARAEYWYEFALQKRRRYKPHSVYGFVGAGISSASITHDFKNNYTEEKFLEKFGNLRTKDKDLTEVTPYGFGYQYDFNSKFLLGAEVGWQFPLSDFLDGLDPGESSKSNDILFGVSVTLAYKIF